MEKVVTSLNVKQHSITQSGLRVDFLANSESEANSQTISKTQCFPLAADLAKQSSDLAPTV